MPENTVQSDCEGDSLTLPSAISVVSLKNTFEGSLINPAADDDATKTFRLGEVASHELGHAVGFESNGFINFLTVGTADLFRSNLMDEKQGKSDSLTRPTL